MTLAKALGNGFPVGACLAAGKAKDIFSPGTHGSTFGGNPLATRAGLTVIDIMEKENLCDAAAEMGEYFVSSFKQALADVEGVVDIRGHGMMIGIELDKDCGELVKQALDKQLLINVTAGKVIRLLPPLILTKEQANTVVSTVVSLIKDFN
jgi:acetylornithine aminotransferase